MFEEYLHDAAEFLEIGHGASAANDAPKARSYFRATVFCTSSAMEAFVNYVADSFLKAESLEKHELAFLNDQRLAFLPGKGLSEKTEYHSIDAKLRVLLDRFSPGFDFGGMTWGEFMRFKDLRDDLVHPRAFQDDTPIATYAKEIPTGLRATVHLMSQVSLAVFGSPLRKQLLDLAPD